MGEGGGTGQTVIAKGQKTQQYVSNLVSVVFNLLECEPYRWLPRGNTILVSGCSHQNQTMCVETNLQGPCWRARLTSHYGKALLEPAGASKGAKRILKQSAMPDDTLKKGTKKGQEITHECQALSIRRRCVTTTGRHVRNRHVDISSRQS